jgi:hypothetical protein
VKTRLVAFLVDKATSSVHRPSAWRPIPLPTAWRLMAAQPACIRIRRHSRESPHGTQSHNQCSLSYRDLHHELSVGSAQCAHVDSAEEGAVVRSRPQRRPVPTSRMQTAPSRRGICRKLDGAPLIIELAAGRVEGYGLQGYGLQRTAVLLEPAVAPDSARRRRSRRRSRPPPTGATSSCPRSNVRCCAASPCSSGVSPSMRPWRSSPAPPSTAALVFGAMDGRVAKSMVAARPAGAMMRYRLLDTTQCSSATRASS